MADQLNADANRYFNELGNELLNNPDLYPDYVPPAAPGPYIKITNEKCSSIFGM